MKLRVSLRPTEALGQEKGEVATACVDCGNGEQILRWLAFAACDRVAHLAGLRGDVRPQAVMGKGIVEDVDARAVRGRRRRRRARSRGPEAFTAQWSRPTPPAGRPPRVRPKTNAPRTRYSTSAATDTPEPHHAAGVAWLEQSSISTRSIREPWRLGVSRSDKLRGSEELAAARAALLAHAGGLQALFKLYESDGDVEMRDVDKMNLEQFRRFMVDAKAIEFGPQTITAADVDSCFNEALKRKGGEKEQKGVAKTLDAVAFLVAVFRVAAKKYDLAVIKAPDVGFAELHRRLDHFVEARARVPLAPSRGCTRTWRAPSPTRTRARRCKRRSDSSRRPRRCACRAGLRARSGGLRARPDENATEWGVLGDDADDASSPDAAKPQPAREFLQRSPMRGSPRRAQRWRAKASPERRRRARGGVRPDAPARVDLHAYAQAVIDGRKTWGLRCSAGGVPGAPHRGAVRKAAPGARVAAAWARRARSAPRRRRRRRAPRRRRGGGAELAAGEGTSPTRPRAIPKRGTARRRGGRRRAARGGRRPRRQNPPTPSTPRLLSRNTCARSSWTSFTRRACRGALGGRTGGARLDGDPEDWSDEERSETEA